MVTALVVWDGLSPVDAGGAVDSYSVRVFDTSSGVDVPDVSVRSTIRTAMSSPARLKLSICQFVSANSNPNLTTHYS